MSPRHPRRIRSHPSDHKYLHATVTPTHRGRNRRPRGSIPPLTVWKPQLHHQLIADWLGFVEPAPPGEDKVPSPDHNYFHTCAIPTHRGQNLRSPRSIPSRTVWKLSNPTRSLLIGWGVVQPAPSGKDKVPSPYQKSFQASATPTHRGRKRCPPGRHRPARCGTPNSTGFRGASATRRGQGPIPGSEIIPYIYNSNTPRTKTVVPGRYRPGRCGKLKSTG